MKKFFFVLFALAFCLPQIFRAQIPTNTLVQIVKAEDERRYDATLENLLKNTNAKIRQRAALAAGRIGDERAIPALIAHLKDDPAQAAMILFALGEIESPNAAPEIAKILQNTAQTDEIRARAIEAAGKIAAANPKDAKTSELGKAIVSALDYELGKGLARHREIVLLGITAILRARPEDGEAITARFLDDSDARIRADALNTLARLRSKNVNEKARELLARDLDPIVRSNAARMLGAGEDKSAIDLLLNAATKDVDSRVRVSAIRSLGNLRDEFSTDKVFKELISNIVRIQVVEAACQGANDTAKVIRQLSRIKQNNSVNVNKSCYDSKSEYLEIATTLGKILAGTNDKRAIGFLQQFRELDKYESPETEIAFAKIAPQLYLDSLTNDKTKFNPSWRAVSSIMQGLAETANLPDDKKEIRKSAAAFAASMIIFQPSIEGDAALALSDVLRAFAATAKDLDFSDLPASEGKITSADYAAFMLRGFVKYRAKSAPAESGFPNFNTGSGYYDPIVRATAAELLSELPSNKETVETLKTAFNQALLADKRENDAQLAILNALYKLDKKAAVGTFLIALGAPDYLVRKRAFEILKDADLQKDFPGIRSSLADYAEKKRNQVLPYAAYTGTKLGQTFYTNSDYIRAVSRKNGTVKAVLTTTKGSFTIDFFPEDAPLTVDNFIRLARANYFNGVSVHRVVPNFVMQDGDPRGDGNGGPGWQIRCEINTLPYERGAVGMALSGKDTGGSQWFATHSPQPHLDGGYTVFGKVNENDMKVVDSIVRGDKILRVRIIEKTAGKLSKKR